MIRGIDLWTLEPFSGRIGVGRSHFWAIYNYLILQWFRQFSRIKHFLSCCHFGPLGFSRKICLNQVSRLVEWAEMSVWTTVNAEFGPLDRAEITGLLVYAFEAQNHDLKAIFLVFFNIWKFQSTSTVDFGPKTAPIQKCFPGIKLLKWSGESIYGL